MTIGRPPTVGTRPRVLPRNRLPGRSLHSLWMNRLSCLQDLYTRTTDETPTSPSPAPSKEGPTQPTSSQPQTLTLTRLPLNPRSHPQNPQARNPLLTPSARPSPATGTARQTSTTTTGTLGTPSPPNVHHSSQRLPPTPSQHHSMSRPSPAGGRIRCRARDR
jgi:hypothetical protein